MKRACLQTYQDLFGAPAADVDCALDDVERCRARELRGQGRRPTFADIPAVRMFGPLLPPAGFVRENGNG